MAEHSLNRSMDSAKKHYSSMFFLPSLKTALLSVAVVCIVGVSLSAYAMFASFICLVLGTSLFALSFFASSIVSKGVLKNDPIFTMRRTLVVSLTGWLFWLALLALGAGVGFLFGNLVWIQLSLLGFASVVTLRFIVILATSSAAKWRQLLSILLEPALCMVAFLLFFTALSVAVTWQILAFTVAAPAVALVAVYILLISIDRLGQSNYGLPALSLFRAFILNWVTDLNEPLEKQLEVIGQDSDVEVSLLKFDASKPKAAIIVPLVHPGPFKNIGSSILPSLLKNGYKQKYGCDACVPLGILGHELDLTSQSQNQKILSQVISSAQFEVSAGLASPFVKATEGFATACCQIFGDTAFLSFSLSPKTTEDLPQELGRDVTEESRRLGLKKAVIVNAHNCITNVVDTDQHVDALRTAAFKCLQKAVSQPTQPFMVGAASVFPSEFTLKVGMGTGGITAVVVQVGKQKTANIVIDGNNMTSGLREKLLGALASMGFDESEVFTTDTHEVSALVTGRRGYHPVGEAMDHEVLTRYIGEAAKKAEANLEPCKSGCVQFVVPKVRVIGEERLGAISTLVDNAIIKVKRIVVPIFGLEGLILLLLLLLL